MFNIKMPKIEVKGLKKRLAKAAAVLFTITFATYGLHTYISSKSDSDPTSFILMTATIMALAVYVMFEE